ncbi:MAG: hypothetical protein O2913_11330 [Chloroflexi bacterium]|nr:hypothetical protein [Chloroflexota bacterium]
MATMNRPLDAKVNASVNVTFDLLLDDRGGHWAALIEQLGTTVYADTEEAVFDRAGEMIQFVVSSFREHSTLQDFRRYLDIRGVQHSVTIHDLRRDRPYPPRRYRREESFAFST